MLDLCSVSNIVYSAGDKNHTHYLLVDECQRLYDARAHADDFFNTLKFMSSSSCPGVVIVVSIMYGSQPSGVEIEAEEGQIVEVRFQCHNAVSLSIRYVKCV